jgi:hypothetical protein
MKGINGRRRRIECYGEGEEEAISVGRKGRGREEEEEILVCR